MHAEKKYCPLTIENAGKQGHHGQTQPAFPYFACRRITRQEHTHNNKHQDPLHPQPARMGVPWQNPLLSFSSPYISPQFAITTSCLGLSPAPVGSASIFFTKSRPSTTLPNTTCLPSSHVLQIAEITEKDHMSQVHGAVVVCISKKNRHKQQSIDHARHIPIQ
jgi:hypothetical protein